MITRFALLTLAFGGMLLTGMPVHAAPAGPSAPVDIVDLGPYLWRNRVLLVFASSADDPAFAQQRDLLAGQEAGITDRDLVIGMLTDATGGTLAETGVSAEAVAVLRAQFEIPRGRFAVLLLGKDGGVKLRHAKPITTEALFARIDTMPMRQAEMR